MRLNKKLVLSGIALMVAACSSKTNDDDEMGSGGVGGTYGGLGGDANNGTPTGGRTNNPGNVGGSGSPGGDPGVGGNGNPANLGGANSNQGGGANAGGGNQAGDNGVGGSCTVKSVRAVLTPPAIEFQVDTTNSMTQTTSTTNGMTKWQATQVALANVLPKLPRDWLVGITFFNKPVGSCYQGRQGVDIAPLASNLQPLLDAINGITLNPNVDSWTPTLNAWMFAFDYITGQWPARTQYANSHKYIVLMTDGVPTVDRDGCTTGRACQVACIAQSEYDYFVSYISSLGMPNGVKTFFIGVPGSESAQGAPYDPRTMLSQLAMAGGSAPAGCVPNATTGQYCHIDLTQAADMSNALSSAIEYTVGDQIKPTCEFDIPKATDSSTYINLDYTTVDFLPAENAAAQRLKRATAADCTDGEYYYNDPSKPTQLNLCPTTCDALGATTTGSVQINFECTKIG